MNTRLNKLLAAQTEPLKGGAWIDCYNQKIQYDVAGTIIAGVMSKNHYFVTIDKNMKLQEPIIGALRGRNPENPSERARSNGRYKQRLELNENGTANTLTSVEKDNLVVEPINTQDGVCRTIKAQYTFTSRANLTRQDALGATGATDGVRIRKLTPRECFRLQGVREEDIDKIEAAGISRTQQTHLAGNSICVPCLASIFYQMFIGNRNSNQQLTIF